MTLGEPMRTWISLAPAERTIRTILRRLVPRTMESSMSTTRLPGKKSGSGLNFCFTPSSRLAWVGLMKVRPT